MNVDDIVKEFNKFDGKYSFSAIFSDWVEACALAISNIVYTPVRNKREQRYNEIMNRYSIDEQKRFIDMFGMLVICLENEIKDVLGEIYMKGLQGISKTGQFFTPFHISQLVSGCIRDLPSEPVIINEPACGSGGMIIAYLEYLKKHDINYQQVVKIIAQDIDYRCVHMAYVQFSLLGANAIVIQGDALLDEPVSEERVFRTPKNLEVIC